MHSNFEPHPPFSNPLQAVFSYWNLLAFTTAPLEQISLAFVPASKPGWQRRSTIAFVLGLGAVVGAVSGLLSAAVPLLAPQVGRGGRGVGCVWL